MVFSICFFFGSCIRYKKFIIIARKSCDEGWKLEYHGYLMAGYYKHYAGTTYKCVDKTQKAYKAVILTATATCSYTWREGVAP